MKIIDLKCENLHNPLAVDSISPRFGWIIESEKYNVMQKSYRILVSSNEKLLNDNTPDMWDSQWVESDNSICINYQGRTLQSKQLYWWKVSIKTNDENKSVSSNAHFGTGIFSEEEWQCGFIGLDPVYTAIIEEASGIAGAPSPYLRHEIDISSEILHARAYVTALGLYELHINGRKAGSDCMTPGWTDYRESLQYQAYDVTNLLKPGINAVGAILADGWYAGNIAIVGRHQYGPYPLGLRLHIFVEYMDGTSNCFIADRNWKGTTGSILYSDNQTGEFIDARKEPLGWDLPGYDDRQWVPVISVASDHIGSMKTNKGPETQIAEAREPLSVTYEINGKAIYDMGQNMVGRIAFFMKCHNGQRITFRYGEMLQKDGTLYVENLRSALQTDIYIARGDENGEVFEPRFTFHGFRYVEISGLDTLPSIHNLSGRVIYSKCEITGRIETSNPLINQLFSNQLWGQKGNFLSVPTDCPQRDERMGWTGDAQIFANTACYNMNCKGFYEKYIADCLESQKPNGAITDVVPNVRRSDTTDLVGNGNAAWGDAIFIIPWVVYQMYGDTTILENSYQGMCRYLKYLETTSTDFLRPDHGYGDWLNVDEHTPKDVLSTAYFAYAAKITSDVANAIGKRQEGQQFDLLYINIKSAFNKAFVNSDGLIKGDTQCCYLLAIRFGLLSPSGETKAIRHLLRTIERKNGHLATGFVGVGYLLPVLSTEGCNDVAYQILLNETYPSWGYSIKNGATTLWERWNSYTEEDGFGDVGMNSFNHYSLGSVGEWLYRFMGGIQPLKPGFKEIVIHPMMDDSLDSSNVCYRSVHGEIQCKWERDANCTKVHIKIPSNTKARIVFRNAADVLAFPEIEKKQKQSEETTYFTGSGEYYFEINPIKSRINSHFETHSMSLSEYSDVKVLSGV